VGPAFCSGLFALAVLPSQGVAVPRWLIVVCGFGCVLLALAASLLGRPDSAPRPSGGRDHGPLTGEGTASALGDAPAGRRMTPNGIAR
jgi:hypothetical protein